MTAPTPELLAAAARASSFSTHALKHRNQLGRRAPQQRRSLCVCSQRLHLAGGSVRIKGLVQSEKSNGLSPLACSRVNRGLSNRVTDVP